MVRNGVHRRKVRPAGNNEAGDDDFPAADDSSKVDRRLKLWLRPLIGLAVLLSLVIVGGYYMSSSKDVTLTKPSSTRVHGDKRSKTASEVVDNKPKVLQDDVEKNLIESKEAELKAKKRTKKVQSVAPEEVENPEITPILKCPAGYGSPAPGRKQRCCELTPGKLSCLPNLVVLGAQKAGTTVVHSYLIVHPQLLAARKKEMHIFDFDKNFMIMKERLSILLPPVEPQLVTQRITVDSSPSYIADHKACPRMAKILSKDARFVLLLREPSERTWSELQMKSRRVQVQNEFLFDILPRYHSEFRRCLSPCMGKCNLEKVKKCLPDDIRQHGRLSVFVRYVNDPNRDGKGFINECFDSPDSVRTCLRTTFEDAVMKETMPVLPDEIEEEVRNLTKIMQKCCTPGQRNGQLTRTNGVVVLDDSYESAGLFAESDEFGFCEGCGCHCFPRATMISDLARYHVWRSLYYPQLVHCYQSIDPARILVIDMAELESNMQSAMSKIFKHAGIKDMDISQYSPEQVQAIFRQHYPDFENISGWAHGKFNDDLPKKMPASLKAVVDDFLRPYNRKLFEMLGVAPFKGWAV